jgi:trans-aconitate methyltransferase
MTGTPSSYFERLYDADPDPWGFESRWYERRKYALTLAALPEERYRRGFEPGCSIGVLTEGLAGRCEELIASDACAAPLERARERLARHDHVAVRLMSVPEEWPEGPFDLIVLSEIAYYLDPSCFETLLDRLRASATRDLVVVHWRGPTDYPLSGDEVHRRLAEAEGFRCVASYEESQFRLDVLRSHAAD